MLNEEGVCINSCCEGFHLDGLSGEEAKQYVINFLEENHLGAAKSLISCETGYSRVNVIGGSLYRLSILKMALVVL